MASIKKTIRHVASQPIKVRVAVGFVLTVFSLFVLMLVVSAVMDLGVLGALAVFGGLALFGLFFWSIITICNSDL